MRTLDFPACTLKPCLTTQVTFCDTPVRDVADIVHIHTFQCVLPLNM